MAGRSPARFLAPLALVAFAVALFVVVDGARDTETEATPNRTSTGEPTPTPTTKGGRRTRRRYTIKAGDTPSAIAERTGVPLADILRLNPDLDPQALTPGQRIKLRQ